MGDPYAVLGIPRTATEDEITQAYRRLARKYHPDLNPGNDAAEEKMKEVNGAYEAIRDIRNGGSTADHRYGASSQGSYYGGSAYGWNPYGNRNRSGGTGGYGYGQQNAYGGWSFYGGGESGFDFGFRKQQQDPKTWSHQDQTRRRPISLFKMILYFNLAQMFLSFLLRGCSLIGGYGDGNRYMDSIYNTPPYEQSEWYEPEANTYQMP